MTVDVVYGMLSPSEGFYHGIRRGLEWGNRKTYPRSTGQTSAAHRRRVLQASATEQNQSAAEYGRRAILAVPRQALWQAYPEESRLGGLAACTALLRRLTIEV